MKALRFGGRVLALECRPFFTLWMPLASVYGALPLVAQTPPVAIPEDLRPVAVPRTPLGKAMRAQEDVDADPASYAPRWQASRAFTVAAMVESDRDAKKTLAYRARDHAVRAVAADSSGLEGHYWLAAASGVLADIEGGRTRIELAEEAWDESGQVLAADSSHAGAHYLRGRIHAAAGRLNAFLRFLARHVLGADVLAQTSWEGALEHLERAVALEPDSPMYHFELAAAYRDIDRPDAMRRALQAAVQARGTGIDAIDEAYRERAGALLESLGRR